MNTIEASLVFAAIVIIIFFIMRAKDKGNEHAVANEKEYLRYNGNDTVTILERCSGITAYLAVEQYRQSSYKFNPATATYTGVTVGGVTTGGWTVDEAHYSPEVGRYTGKYNLFYKERRQIGGKWEADWHLINYVILSDQDAKAAKDAGLGRWLSGNTISISNPLSSRDRVLTESIYEQYGNGYDFYSTSNLLSMQAEKTMLSHDEIMKIYSFICGDTMAEVDPNRFVCQACGKTFSGWYQECPSCHAKGKMKKRT